jgi:molybdenum cofactor cytidylyltransferase
VRIVGVLLAAGRGERFGGAKLRAPLPHATPDVAAGTPIGVAACRHLVLAVSETVAVVRPGDYALAEELRHAGARVVVCANAALGMGRSLACGVRAAHNADGWIVALADMPWVRPATIRALATTLAEGADIVAPSYLGERGNPVGFSRRHFAALTALQNDEGARAIVAANRETMTLQHGDDAGVVRDVDLKSDLR